MYCDNMLRLTFTKSLYSQFSENNMNIKWNVSVSFGMNEKCIHMYGKLTSGYSN